MDHYKKILTQTIDFLFKTPLNRILFFFSISLLIFFVSSNLGIFWDNVLFVSRTGNFLYSDNIFNWNLPNDLDAGHPPTFGFLLAVLWKIFGHKLWVSHLLMIPFTAGLLYQLFRFTSFYIKSYTFIFFALLLIIADPTLITQLVLVTPEIILFFLFFLAINSILYKKNNMKIIALFFLSIISLRSMMLCAGIFLFEIFNYLYINKGKLKFLLSIKFIKGYVIASLPALIYLTLHHINKGWLISHVNSPWASHRNFASLSEILKNTIVLTHRYLDFGRFLIYIFIVYTLLKYNKKAFNKNTQQLLLLSFSSVIIIILISIFGTNTFGHRYFVISFIILNFLSFYLLIEFYRLKKIIYTILLFTLITGNLWVYPREIAQGWDASLAHLPYYNLRYQAILYLDTEKIDINTVATFFPNTTTLDNIDFNEDYRSFVHFNGQNEYVLFSNIFNLTDKDYHILDNNYSIHKRFEKNNIYINIYKLKQ